jgi:carbonic anhydrase
MITEPGPIKALATEPLAPQVESIRRRLEVSLQKHHSNLVAVVGHDDCAGNPVDLDRQTHQLNAASDLIYTWGYPIDIIRLYVDGNRTVHQLP